MDEDLPCQELPVVLSIMDSKVKRGLTVEMYSSSTSLTHSLTFCTPSLV
jgi:hypothetical protein